jgi:hypothetical protein
VLAVEAGFIFVDDLSEATEDLGFNAPEDDWGFAEGVFAVVERVVDFEGVFGVLGVLGVEAPARVFLLLRG